AWHPRGARDHNGQGRARGASPGSGRDSVEHLLHHRRLCPGGCPRAV
ncbi:MAG: hypothetical protein AVDCRST_MAG01-01-1619, partial [uncultured Rubrobacteraceae bacterium]